MQIFTLRERPDLRPLIFSADFESPLWPEYMRHDAAAQLYFAPLYLDRYLDFAFAGVHDGKVVARAFSVPFAFGVAGRSELPDGGWDEVIRWAHEDHAVGREPTALSALEIGLLPQVRGAGNSRLMLDAMKARARAHDFADLFAPVRPNQKYLQPFMPMADYVDTLRSDGLPTDAWLRTHVRIGGRIVKIAPYAMTIVGTLAEWSRWTGMTFDASGAVVVAGALSPVWVSLEQDFAVYVEPGVWVHHAL
jgi:GNAT superfamily N-acetyltransferase